MAGFPAASVWSARMVNDPSAVAVRFRFVVHAPAVQVGDAVAGPEIETALPFSLQVPDTVNAAMFADVT